MARRSGFDLDLDRFDALARRTPVLANLRPLRAEVAADRAIRLAQYAVLGVGGQHITNDIAYGLHLPTELAESVKLTHGHADPKAVSALEAFPIQPFGEELPSKVQRTDLAHIVHMRVAEMFELIRSFGKRVRYHSCGGVRDILPDLIDIGLEVLTPFQPLARGMEPLALKRDFGRHITFHGGIDMQELLPHGTVQQVRDETRRLLDALNDGGGWIACSSHNLQPDTPPGNIVAMYEVLLGRSLT